MPAKDELLKQEIQAVHRQHPAYGHYRVALELGINHKRAQRVMAKYNLRPPRRRAKHYCTRSTPHHTYSNQLKEHLPVTQVHHVWCVTSVAWSIEVRSDIWQRLKMWQLVKLLQSRLANVMIVNWC